MDLRRVVFEKKKKPKNTGLWRPIYPTHRQLQIVCAKQSCLKLEVCIRQIWRTPKSTEQNDTACEHQITFQDFDKRPKVFCRNSFNVTTDKHPTTCDGSVRQQARQTKVQTTSILPRKLWPQFRSERSFAGKDCWRWIQLCAPLVQPKTTLLTVFVLWQTRFCAELSFRVQKVQRMWRHSPGKMLEYQCSCYVSDKRTYKNIEECELLKS